MIDITIPKMSLKGRTGLARDRGQLTQPGVTDKRAVVLNQCCHQPQQEGHSNHKEIREN